MISQEENTKRKSGLPDIAQLNNKRKPVMLIILAGILLAFYSIYYFKKSNQEVAKPVEETYTIDTDSLLEDKKVTTNSEDNTSPSSPAPEVKPEIVQQRMVLIQEKQKELQQRLSAPLMLVNNNATSSATSNTNNANSQTTSQDENTQFMNQVANQETSTVQAKTMGQLNTIIAEGTLIHGILESATHSDLPGFLRAIVSTPVYAEDGSQVLIPPGSRLIGQYKCGMLQGQSRIFIVWTRVITPQGISIQLGSAGVDSLGMAGIGADEINRHFWQRFGTASLLSVLGAGAANVGVNGNTQENSASEYRAAVASSFAQSAGQSLQQEGMIAPTLKTHQGKPIIVFVAKDIEFKEVIKLVKPKVNLL